MNNTLNEIEISIKIKKPRRILVFIISFMITLVIGITDYISGYEMSFSIFYLVPITIAIAFSDRTLGLVISIFSAGIWLTADLYSGHTYSNILIPFWNSLMRLGYFSLHTFLFAKIIQLYQVSKNLSLTDPLTNIGNWRLFQEIFQRELNKAKRTNLPFSLVYFDLDNFKKMNDTFGHTAGDDLLKSIANEISILVRPVDLLARLGGDEFALLLPETDFSKTKVIIERIRNVLSKRLDEKQWSVTLSIGVINYNKFNLSPDEMIKKADDLMYNVKKNGKNNVEYQIYPEDENKFAHVRTA